MSSLEVVKLIKRYHGSSGFTLGPLDLAIGTGDCLAVIGPNGSGKTTLFQCLTGHMKPSEGSILLDGKVVSCEQNETRRLFGYLPQNLSLPLWVTPREVLHYLGLLHQQPHVEQRIMDLAQQWDFSGYLDRPLGRCSHGMQKRVALGIAAFHHPPIVILDEPFSGLDLFHIQALVAWINLRTEQGLTTILSTHLLFYASRLCETAILVHDGNIQLMQQWQESGHDQRVSMVEKFFFS